MNLVLFLSDRCNLACGYCFLDLNHGAPVVLSADDAVAAVRAHAADPGPGEAQVTFLGGEPLIHLDLLERAAVAAREAGHGRLRLAAVTNGLLATPEKLERLRALGVSLTVSLDGDAAVNDRHRRTPAGAPSLERALAALPARSGMRCNMVVAPDTAASLLSSVDFLRREGFRRISFHPDVRGGWTGESLAALRVSLAGLRRYVASLPAGALELTHLSSFASRTSGPHGYDDLVLGADGRYYPCDGLFALPYSRLADWAAGDARSGPDRGRIEAALADAQRAVHAALAGESHYTCPRETYFLSLAEGRDPVPAVRAFHAADCAIGDALAPMCAEVMTGGTNA